MPPTDAAPTAAPYVDPDLACRSLLTLESAVAGRGWDQPPMLFALRRAPGPGFLVPTPLIVPLGAWASGTPYDVVSTVADMVDPDPNDADPPPARAVKGLTAWLASPDFAGVGLLVEQWQYVGDPEQVNGVETSGRSLADIPGSVEARSVLAVDRDGRAYFVSRVRGKEPAAEWFHRDGTYGGAAGTVPHPLATVGGRMLAALARFVNVANAALGLPPVPSHHRASGDAAEPTGAGEGAGS